MSSNEDLTSTPLIPLSKRDLPLVLIGCFTLVLFITGAGATISLILTPKLSQLGALEQFAFGTILGSLGVAIMTPIGGSLGNIVGRKTMLIVPSVIAIISIIWLAYSQSFATFAFSRFILSLAIGVYTSSPYILISLVARRKDVPKYMGLMASGQAVGIFIGPSLGGIILELGYLELATYFMAIFPLIGVILLQFSLPKIPGNSKLKLDWVGTLMLAAIISIFVFVLNFLPSLGWANPYIIGGIIAFAILLPLFVIFEDKLDKKGCNPVIPVRLFKNLEYTALLIIGLTTFFFVMPMTAYGARAGYDVVNASSVTIGLFPLPRTITTLILPTFAGIWISRKAKNAWIAMAIATGLPAIALLSFVFITPSTPVSMFFLAYGLTGISESFRAVSVTPAAQDTLTLEDLGLGTALSNFFNSMGSVTGASVAGYLYNLAGGNVQSGIQNAFTALALAPAIGFLIVIFYLRPKIFKRAKMNNKDPEV